MEKVLKDATLCFLLRDSEVLLAIKSRFIGEGCWNGYGGGIEVEDASPEEAALRELEQESGIRGSLDSLNKIAVVDFHNIKSDGEKFRCRVHTYLLTKWAGEAIETEEMLQPTWFRIDKLPIEEMMLADRFWVPRIFLGEPFFAKAWYGPKQQTLLRDVEFSELPEELKTDS